MSKKRFALSGFSKIKDAEMLVLAPAVLTSMTNNVDFPDPRPDLEVLDAAILDYKTKLAQSILNKGVVDNALKNDSKENLGFILTSLAQYVNSKAKGDLSLLFSTGFNISKATETYYVSDKIELVKIVDGLISGEVYLSFQSQARTLFYEFCHTTEKESEDEYNWGLIQRSTSSIKNLITDVEPFKLNYFRVRATNKKGTGDWSEPVSFFVR